MSKRFTDSEKFGDIWYRKLKPKHKCLWEFFLSKCDIAGIIELDFESMSFHIGDTITQDDLRHFQDKIVFIGEDKIFIPNFIKFQQNELNENNPAHKNIIKKLKSLNIDCTLDFKELQSSFEGASKPLSRDISIVRYSKGKVKEKINYKKFFEDFYSEYPNKKSKVKAEQKFCMLLKSSKEPEKLFEQIMQGVKNYNALIKSENTEAKFIKHPVTWLNGGCWEDQEADNKTAEYKTSEFKDLSDAVKHEFFNIGIYDTDYLLDYYGCFSKPNDQIILTVEEKQFNNWQKHLGVLEKYAIKLVRKG